MNFFSILITVVLFFSVCIYEEYQDYEEYRDYEDESVNFPFVITYENNLKLKTYQVQRGSNHFILDNIPKNCDITFNTIYNDYNSFYIFYDQHSYYDSSLSDYLEIQDFDIDTGSGEISFTYRVMHRERFTVVLSMINNSFVQVSTNCLEGL